MNLPLRLLLAATCLSLVACGPDGGDDDGTDCVGEFLPGDLVITEVFANPSGDDSGREWFEVYNATGQPADLTGLVLVASKDDMSGEDSHTMTEIVVAADDYVVLGGVLQEFAPPHVDYGFANDLGSLRNTEGRLALQCGSREVDAMIYETSPDGASYSFDGGQAPNHTANDNLMNWCDATVEYETGSLGSPGAANETCPGLATTCNDGGTDREIVKPVAGDLVITEFLANATGADTDKEWFEVYVVNDVDLNNLQMGRTVGSVDTTLDDANCLRVTSGTRLVFAQSSDMGVNGGLPQADYLFDFTLGNSTGSLFIGIDNMVLDDISWTNAPEGSRNLDPDSRNPSDNDGETNWCDTIATYGDGDNGTPGLANEQCPIVVPPGMCNDGGTLRALVPPIPADVMITEFLSDPGMTGGDADREWFEVRFAADADINGLQMGKVFNPSLTVLDTVPQGDCIRVTAGTYAIFAHTTTAAVNGNLPFVTALFDFALNQDNSGIFVAINDTLLDGYEYGTTQDGVALSKDNGGTWCDAVTQWFMMMGDFGTPGMANPDCPQP